MDIGDNMIYLDNAATTLVKPKEVVDAITYALTHFGNPERSIHSASLEASRCVFQTRKAIAKLFNAHSINEIVFTKNATESLNVAIKGLISEQDHVITSILEHNSVLRPLYNLEAKGMELSFVNCDDNGVLYYDEIESYIKANTKAIVCTHASNVTGNVVDIKRIGKIAKKHNLLFIVDASQSAGAIEIDVQDMHIDVLCFTGHKALFGPQGIGGMVVNENVSIPSFMQGGSGIDSFSKSHPLKMPTQLEAGTINAHGVAGLLAGIQFIEKETMQKIHEKEMMLMWAFYEKVKKIPNVRVYGDFTNKERCPIVTIAMDEDASSVADYLAYTYDIATRAGAHCAPLMHTHFKSEEKGLIRFSFSYFNTLEEIDIVIQALEEIRKG